MAEEKNRRIEEFVQAYQELDPDQQRIMDGLALAMFRETPVEKEIEGDKNTWWYVCAVCHTAADPKDKYCRECGQRLK